MPTIIPLRSSLLLLTAAVGLLLGGCSRDITLRVRGVSPLNVNDVGETTPVKVRIYQLANDGKFRAATVDALWTDDQGALGSDRLTDPLITTVFPGGAGEEPVKVELKEVKDSAKFIGILALYSSADAKDQRTAILSAEEADDKILQFSGSAVQVLANDGQAAQPAKDDSEKKPASKPKSGK